MARTVGPSAAMAVAGAGRYRQGVYKPGPIRSRIGCALIIPMIIQTILLDPSGAVWTDKASNVSRPDPSETDQADAEHPVS